MQARQREARQRDPHVRLSVAQRHVRRRLHLRDDGRHARHRPGDRARLHDPTTDPHDLFPALQTHPAIKPMLEGAKLLRYGAKAIPEGGLYAMPRHYADGLALHRRLRGFPQRHASQRHPLGDEVGHDRGRDGLRSARRRQDRRREPVVVRRRVQGVVGLHGTVRRRATSTPASRTGCSPGCSTPASACTRAAAASASASG